MSSQTGDVNKKESNSPGRCGLCETITALDEEGVPYIICQPCYSKFLRVSAVYKRQLDELPFGVIDLDSQGTVMAYNRTEADMAQLQAEKVVGRNFFTEIAPCTAVKEFQGRFNEFLAGSERTLRFNFTFSFKHGPVEVEIFFLRRAEDREIPQEDSHTRIIVKRVIT